MRRPHRIPWDWEKTRSPDILSGITSWPDGHLQEPSLWRQFRWWCDQNDIEPVAYMEWRSDSIMDEYGKAIVLILPEGTMKRLQVAKGLRELDIPEYVF